MHYIVYKWTVRCTDSWYLFNMDPNFAGRPAVAPFKSFVASNKQYDKLLQRCIQGPGRINNPSAAPRNKIHVEDARVIAVLVLRTFFGVLSVFSEDGHCELQPAGTLRVPHARILAIAQQTYTDPLSPPIDNNKCNE